ncbi:MAG: tetratricopeptide repeat protein [Candidatus Rokubacteria bacterium]|nr:tetratricopeptide repeat protein [Candidatus Rokubacteria bacterium]
MATLFGATLAVGLVSAPASAQQAEAEVFVAQAILAYEEKRYEDALAALGQALELDPNNVDALYYTGLVRVALGRFDQAVEALERARTRDPKDQTVLFQLGVVYFSLEKYEQAQLLLEQVFTVNPRLDGLGYYVGFMRYRKKDYQGALRAFRAGATTDPNIQQLTRFYSGLALGILGLPERAAAEIEEALRLQPASPLTGPAERLREAVVAAREKERRFRAEVRVGGFFDDNVSVNPEPSADALVQVLRQQKHESPGWLASLRLDYAFLRIGSVEATATYSFFTTYNNDLPSFNIVDHLGGLGVTYRSTVGALPYQLALQYAYDFLTLDDDEFVQRHTVAPVAALVENLNNLTALQLRYQNKQFANDTNIPREDKRDGNNWMAGLTHIFRFEGDKHLLKLGYQWDFDDTEGPSRRGKNFSYLGHRVLAGLQYTLPWAGLRFKYDFDIHLRDYRNTNTLLPVASPNTKERFDTESTHMVGLTLPLPYDLTLAAEYQRIVSRSNLAVFSFDRNVVSLSLIWSY